MVGGVQIGAERTMEEEEGDSGESDDRSYYDQHYGVYQLYKMINTSSYKLQVTSYTYHSIFECRHKSSL